MKKTRRAPTAILALLLTFALLLTGCSAPSRQVSINWPNETPNAQLSATISPIQPDTTSAPMSTPNYNVDSQKLHDGSWAIYWYLCGSNLESEDGDATADINEMLGVTLPQGVQVVIETGGAKSWNNGFVEVGKQQRYLYSGSDLYRVDEQPGANMGETATLTAFLRYCNENYPAEHQAVVLWDHGGGSIGGVIYDEVYDFDSLSLTELSAAFAESPAASGTYEFVGFDACLMATVDVAALLQGYADYMIASEESEPFCGWDYTGFMKAFAEGARDTEHLGKAICDSYYVACEQYGVDDMTTLSVVDLRKAERFLTAFGRMGNEALIGGVNGQEPYLSSFAAAARDSENYGGNNDVAGYFDMVDVGDLTVRAGTRLLPQTAQAVADALADCVVYKVQGSARNRASGLACYYSYDGDVNVLKRYADLADSPGFSYYHEYALTGSLSRSGQDYVEQVRGDFGSAASAVAPLSGDLGLDGAALSVSNGRYTLNVGAERAKSIARVNLRVLYCGFYDGAPQYAFDIGTSIAVNASGAAGGVFADSFNGSWPMLYEIPYDLFYSECYMEVVDRVPGEYTLYMTPIQLNWEPYVLMLKYSETAKTYQVLGAKRTAGKASGIADKDLRQLVEGDIVCPTWRQTWSYDGSPLPPLEWNPTQQDDEGYRFSHNIAVTDKPFLDGYYRVNFEIIDYAGRRYMSAPGWYEWNESSGKATPVSSENMPVIAG